jgi:hypothetical protein
MAQALKKCQSKEGFWYPNLADPNDYPVKETSGTSFFVYGLAWGVNNGILDYDEYSPAIKKAWRSLVNAVDNEGKVQWGQRVGDRPVNVVQNDSHEYVSGTFLLAASEVYKMCDKWLMTDKIQSFKNRLKTASGITKTGLKKQDYLKVIEDEVRVMRQYQNGEGRIIDTVKHQEMYYSTPCYAHSIAVLAASGYTKDAALIESGMKAMDIVTSDMARNWSAGEHGDFYTWPVMFAYRLYKGIATDDRRAEWLKHIGDMMPDKFYRLYPYNEKDNNNNWALVNTSGEFLRFKENLRPLSDVDTCLKIQMKNFTGYGMYNENGNPFAYDLFSRHYLSGMLAHGYRGAYYEQLRNLLDKGAWMSLFLQSPFGEMPAGYRSAHHIWNEAEQCVIFEIYAAEYAKQNDMKTAEAFKRAAMLSLSSIKSWIRPDGSGYIVKNKYPVEAEHGYEVYSVHSCYNMLATSMLAQAWEFSDDKIREGIAPADVGGFVVSVTKPFHKIIASSGGTYIEYDTQGDLHYNPTGIIRIHLKGSNPQLGPSDGCAELFSGKGIAIATGPTWQNADGTWSSLAKMRQVEPSVEVLDETPAMTRFRVFYKTKDVSIVETITCEKGKITVEDELLCQTSKMRITWPMLTFNGKDKTDVQIDGNTATLRLEDKSIRFTALEPANSSLSRSGKEYGHRNGIVESLFFDFQGNKAKYCIYL